MTFACYFIVAAVGVHRQLQKHNSYVLLNLTKGITVERRRRKASGPDSASSRDSGVAGQLSCVTELSVIHLAFPLPVLFVSRAARRAPGTKIKSRSYESDIGKPVERRGRKASGLLERRARRAALLRQRGCHIRRGRARKAPCARAYA